MLDKEFLMEVSNVVGWLYVLFWGLVCYPQIILNFKLKRYREPLLNSLTHHHFPISVEGFKLDFPFLNLSGFLFYSISFTVAYMNNGPPYGLPFENYGLGRVIILTLNLQSYPLID